MIIAEFMEQLDGNIAMKNYKRSIPMLVQRTIQPTDCERKRA